MDNQKDIQKTQGLGRFLDNQSLKTNPFGQNRIGERAYRRAERLSAAIVLLTNHVPEAEPLRRSARELSVSLISTVLNVKDEMRSASSNKLLELKVLVRNLITIIRLLAVSGSVSIQNAEAVTEALDGLVEFLNASQKSNLAESVSITREDLIDVRDVGARDIVSDKPIRDRIVRPDTLSKIPDTKAIFPTKDMSNISSRSLSIMEILRSDKELGIREIVSNLPEYSEKMIQRELAELVRLGRVSKVGLKRWSRYSLVA